MTDAEDRPRCYRINSNYRTLCRQWNDAGQCTDWAQITCPACLEVRQRWLGAVAGAAPTTTAQET